MNDLTIALQNADKVCARTEEYFDRIDDLQRKADKIKIAKLEIKRVIIGVIVYTILLSLFMSIFRYFLPFSEYSSSSLYKDIFWTLGIALFIGVRRIKKGIADSLNRQIKDQRAYVNRIFEENYDAISFLPEEYWYPMATSYMLKAAACGRVTNIGEALDSFDTYLHRMKLEQLGSEILAEQQVQTEHLRSIRRSSKVSAAANVTNAIFNIANNI